MEYLYDWEEEDYLSQFYVHPVSVNHHFFHFSREALSQRAPGEQLEYTRDITSLPQACYLLPHKHLETM